MLVRGLRISFVVATLALATLAEAQPAFAWTDLGHSGTVGVYSLTDTSSTPGAKCKYHYLSNESLGKLKRIVVRPPTVYAVAGKDRQVVGWQFMVQQKIFSAFGSPGPWEQKYTSLLQTTFAGDSYSAQFSSMGVDITVPFEPGGDAAAAYRVIVKMFWFHKDESVQGTAKALVDWYREVMDTGPTNTDPKYCPDYFAP